MPNNDNTGTVVTASGDAYIDGLVSGYAWGESVITYAFPTSSAAYNGGQPGYPSDWHLQNFQPFSAAYQANVLHWLGEVASFTQLTFVEGSEDTATLRWGRFDDPFNLAYGYYPADVEYGGDMWFANNANPDPIAGEGVSHIIVHELGHALGLAHPHDPPYIMPTDRDSNEYSVMSYVNFVGFQSGDFSGAFYEYEQSFMMLDIAALQYMYGANFDFNATNTTYSFDPATGQMLINAVGGPTPPSVTVFRTIWDGGGIDTYDFSNFDQDQSVDLSPGAWSTFESDMLSERGRRMDGDGVLQPIYAPGNIANALLHAGDLRSLIENALTGAGNDVIVGNQADNVLSANAGADSLSGGAGDDTLDGGIGADTMTGGEGDDLYVVDDAGDVVVELAGQGLDTVRSTFSYTLSVDVENLVLLGSAVRGVGNDSGNTISGNSATNTLEGGLGDDTLIGGGGADMLVGGAGDDTYIIDATDIITELANQGQDTIRAAFSVTLGVHFENLTLIGASAINGTGNSRANVIVGNAASNTLTGGGGGDLLNGGAGADTLDGGAGNDTYVVNALADAILDSGGVDTVQASLNWTLAAGLERLVLSGSANLRGVGNTANNILTGNNGDNMLDGRAGVDTMFGGAGDDTYRVDNAADRTIETANAGTDTVLSSVARTLGANLENLTIYGGLAVAGTGNALANAIVGNNAANSLNGAGGDDILRGGGGDDTLIGGAGSDTLTGNGGADVFVFNAALVPGVVDLISDFNAAADTIRVENAVFAGIGPAGALNPARFHIGAAAADADDRIIYDSATGALYYDSDGTGAATQVQFATLAAGLGLSASDFVVT